MKMYSLVYLQWLCHCWSFLTNQKPEFLSRKCLEVIRGHRVIECNGALACPLVTYMKMLETFRIINCSFIIETKWQKHGLSRVKMWGGGTFPPQSGTHCRNAQFLQIVKITTFASPLDLWKDTLLAHSNEVNGSCGQDETSAWHGDTLKWTWNPGW